MDVTGNKISNEPPATISQNYSDLKDYGLEIIRDIANDTWTDHNVHDPGITFMETFAYALTEIGFKANLPIEDLIASGRRYAAENLPEAHNVLSCSPVSLDDLYKVINDHPMVVTSSIKSENITNTLPIYFDSNAVPPESSGDMDMPLSLIAGDDTYISTTVDGLYEVLLELNPPELNRNTYQIDLQYDGENYLLDIALPHWDEPESAIFDREISISSASGLDVGGEINWRSLDEDYTYYARLNLEFDVASTNEVETLTSQIWIVARIVSENELTRSLALEIINSAQVDSVVRDVAENGLLQRYQSRVGASKSAVKQLLRYLYKWRNLAQEPVKLSVVRSQEISVKARLEVRNGIDLESLLAKVFFNINLFLSPTVASLSLSELQDIFASAADIYDGPLLLNGFVHDLNSDVVANIYLSDILRIIMQSSTYDISSNEDRTASNILSVSELTLSNYINNRLITRGAKDCLSLVEPERYHPRLDLAKSSIVLVRDDIELSYDRNRVEDIYNQTYIEYLQSIKPSANIDLRWPVTDGQPFSIDDYYPFQNDLPSAYGLGDFVLPDNAPVERVASVKQTRAFLTVAEQLLADSVSQLANINQFFSGEHNVQSTAFVHPLYDLVGMDELVRQYDDEATWDDFIQDPANRYITELNRARESESQFVDRRNRMLDNLLARQGESMLSWAQELNRTIYQNLKDEDLDLAVFAEKLESQLLLANRWLITQKVNYLQALPELNKNRFRGTAFEDSGVIRRLHITSNGTQEYVWQINIENDFVFQSSGNFTQRSAAITSAVDAYKLAAQINNYRVIRHTSTRFSLAVLDDTVGESTAVATFNEQWSSAVSAEDAIDLFAEMFTRQIINSSLSHFELLIRHNSGMPTVRQRLINNISHYFEIYDENDGDGVMEKRWRLWRDSGQAGNVLLSSRHHFEAPDEIVDPIEREAFAISLAQDNITQTIRYGLYPWNYKTEQAGENSFNFTLFNTRDEAIAMHMSPIVSIEESKAYETIVQEHLSQYFGAEGFYLVEHILLRPVDASDLLLSLPENREEWVNTPYSHRLSLVFPSGYARDFDSAEIPATRVDVAPHRFRDIEFRKYIQRLVDHYCPAHLLPTIYWVDQSSTAITDNPASFEFFEESYLTWLNNFLVPGINAQVLQSSRNDLVRSLNTIAMREIQRNIL